MKLAVPSSSHAAEASALPQGVLLEAYRHLAAGEAELLPSWRAALQPRAKLSAPVQTALEQLVLPRPLKCGPDAGLPAWVEQIEYTAARLAKLGVPLRQAHEALAAFRPLALSCLRQMWSARRAAALQSAIEQQATLCLAERFVGTSERARVALLAVLDAELGAAGPDEVLQTLLREAARLFPLRWAEVLLAEPGPGGVRLRHAASFGLDAGMIRPGAGAGAFFQQVLQRGTPGFVLDAANDPGVAQPYFRALEVKSLWAVPLVRRGARPQALGILALGFDRVYECLHQEKELLLALAERSTLAVERARMIAGLNRERARVSELSRRLVAAEEEERRRISRDLHDETGQALLALRLYLELGLRQASPRTMRPWLRRGLALVDRSVAELRRILSQLSPLVLDELGLEPALRLELRRLRGLNHWRARFDYRGDGRLDRGLEILIYRIVLEGLRNAARHAQAHAVYLKINLEPAMVRIHLRDDGIGLASASQKGRLGLAGMQERVRLAGGRMELVSAHGQGLHLYIQIPRPRVLAVQAG